MSKFTAQPTILESSLLCIRVICYKSVASLQHGCTSLSEWCIFWTVFTFPHLFERCILGMVMLQHWVVASHVVGNHKGPSPAITLIGVTLVQDITVEDGCIP